MTSDPPVLRLAYSGKRDPTVPEGHAPPALLVSYAYWVPWAAARERCLYRDWALDSGAFTAFRSGRPIEIAAYLDHCLRISSSEDPPSEIFALDVIGSWQGTLSNTAAMWKRGVEAIPCFHIGEPWDVLRGLARDYPKIALGGVAGVTARWQRSDWLEECFARIWPCKVHGFGMAGVELLRRFPFHSVDASSWEVNTCRFGQYTAFGGAHLKVRGSAQDLRAEVLSYLRQEAEARRRWKKTFERLGWIHPRSDSPSRPTGSPKSRKTSRTRRRRSS